MSLHFHPLAISDIRKETPDCVSLAFSVPPDLQEVFQFRAGQTISLRTMLEGEEIRRCYSICSSPLEQELRIAIKAQHKGRFSSYANEQLKPGDVLDVLPPSGNFTPNLDAGAKKNYLAVAAGSGITPILSILKTVFATEPHSRFTLVYGSRNQGSIIFREALSELKNRYLDRFQLFHILSREKTDTPLFEGRINARKCEALGQNLLNWKSFDSVFLCGPEGMIFSVRDYLLGSGVPASSIHFELFYTPTDIPAETTSPDSSLASTADQPARVRITSDGRSRELLVPYAGLPILDAALQSGADLPYSCKGGVCGTCRAKLVSGQVEMESNYALEKEELDAGYILTCQSHPRSEELVIDFDQ